MKSEHKTPLQRGLVFWGSSNYLMNMVNRAWTKEADTTGDLAITVSEMVVAAMESDFYYVPTAQAFKAYDVKFSDGANDLYIECECRDAEEDDNWSKLWNGVYTTIHVPERKYRQPGAMWTDYIAFRASDTPIQVALFKRDHLDTKSKPTRANGEDFRDLSRSLVYFAEVDVGGIIKPHILRSLRQYTLG